MRMEIDPVIAEICRKNPVSEILTSRGIQLVKAGKRWKCKCPIHQERTPSFNIGQFEDGTEYFKCFGCGQSGSSIKLLALLDKVSNGEVVKRLARAAGIKLKPIDSTVKVDPTNEDILQAMCASSYEGVLKRICLKLERFIWKNRGDSDMVNKGMFVYLRAKKLSNIGDEQGLLKLKAVMDELEAGGYNSGVENEKNEGDE